MAVGRYRFVVCALLFLATTVNYVDRQVLGILAGDLQKVLGIDEMHYGYIVTAFQAAYAIGLLLSGSLLDRIGTRLGYALAVGLWSVAAMAHALASSALTLGVARFLLGLFESANFPAAVKAVAEWYPRRERALATGVFNSGSNLGAIVAPLVVPVLTIAFGWQWAFLATGALGFFWLILWLGLYGPLEGHPRVKEEERAYIRSGEKAEARVRLEVIVGTREAWAIALAKFLTDPIWWFYLFWLPKYLREAHGLNLLELGAPLIAIYLAADVGSVLGGYFSSTLISRGVSVNRARKIAMFSCALAVVPITAAPFLTSLWGVVAVIGLAAAGHQGFSANVYTLASDMFPREAVGSVVGFAGMAGSVGGMLIATATGYILQTTGRYWPLFLLAASSYLAALLAVQALSPSLKPAPLPVS